MGREAVGEASGRPFSVSRTRDPRLRLESSEGQGAVLGLMPGWVGRV